MGLKNIFGINKDEAVEDECKDFDEEMEGVIGGLSLDEGDVVRDDGYDRDEGEDEDEDYDEIEEDEEVNDENGLGESDGESSYVRLSKNEMDRFKDEVYKEAHDRVISEAKDILYEVKRHSREDRELKNSLAEKNSIIGSLRKRLESIGKNRYCGDSYDQLDGNVYFTLKIPKTIKTRYVDLSEKSGNLSKYNIESYIDSVLSNGKVITDDLGFTTLKNYRSDDNLKIKIDSVRFRRLEMFCESQSIDVNHIISEFIYHVVVKEWHKINKNAKKVSMSASVPPEVKETFIKACERSNLSARQVLQRMMVEYTILNEPKDEFDFISLFEDGIDV